MMSEKIKEHFSVEFRRIVTSADGTVIYGNFIDSRAVNKVSQGFLDKGL
jgi:hypothetical protein